MKRPMKRLGIATLVASLLVAPVRLRAVDTPAAATAATAEVEPAAGVRLVPLGKGTAKNTVNVVVFRKQSLVTHGDTQFAAAEEHHRFQAERGERREAA